MRWSASGLEAGRCRVGKGGSCRAGIDFYSQRKVNGCSRQNSSPTGSSHGATAIAVTATGILDYGSPGLGGQRIVAVMSLPDAASMLRFGSNRQHQWNKVPHQRKEQQESGDQPMHSMYEPETTRCAQHRTESRTVASA